MDKAAYIRRIDELGRVVLPAEARREMDLREGTPVELRVDGEGREIVIRRHVPACTFCGEAEELKAFEGKAICSACQEQIEKL